MHHIYVTSDNIHCRSLNLRYGGILLRLSTFPEQGLFGNWDWITAPSPINVILLRRCHTGLYLRDIARTNWFKSILAR